MFIYMKFTFQLNEQVQHTSKYKYFVLPKNLHIPVDLHILRLMHVIHWPYLSVFGHSLTADKFVSYSCSYRRIVDVSNRKC